MSDEPRPDEEGASLAMPEPALEAVPEVTFVVPAPPYVSIATDDATAAVPEPEFTPRAGPDLTPALDAVAALGVMLGRQLDGLQTLFEREIRAEATREKVVDRLHAELQEYKQDLLLNVLRPVFVDLIQLHDDIGKMLAARSTGEGEGEGEVRRLLDIMQGYQQGIEDILYRQGVEPYTQEGDTFDPRRQRAVATVPTDDPSLAKTIAVRHRKGFQTQGGERMIRPEIVSVYALKR
jgi:molecular chaperone GrpE